MEERDFTHVAPPDMPVGAIDNVLIAVR